jgi:hypothetical protein
MTNNMWTTVPSAQHPILKQVLLKMNAYFHSTYSSKSEFSTTNIMKSMYRSPLCDTQLSDYVRAVFTK